MVPPADYHLDWHRTFDPQAGALRQRSAVVDPVEWTAEADFAAYEYGGIIGPCEPPPGSAELSKAALEASPAPTTYARVDIVVGNDGQLQVIELELIDPALFMTGIPEAGPRFADAVLSAANG